MAPSTTLALLFCLYTPFILLNKGQGPFKLRLPSVAGTEDSLYNFR